MPRLSRRSPSLALALLLAAAAGLLPPEAAGWGTLTGGLHMSAAELTDLRALISNYAEEPRRDPLLAELDARTGAHPVHQFIVQQALRLLAQDPTLAAAPTALPDVRAVNAWDGVERCEHGMRPTIGSGLAADLPDLAPVRGPVSGPGPDAELATPAGNPFAPGGPAAAGLAGAGLPAGLGGVIASLGYNPFYNGRAHYYSPWLDDGQAPTAAATNYSRLVATLEERVAGNLPAHYTAYLAHYLSDPLSAKPADAFTLDPATLTALVACADRFVAARSDNLATWLASAPVTDAIAALERRVASLAPAQASAYWSRVNAHIADIGGTPLFTRQGHYVWMAPSTLRSAVACYLHELASRPPGRSLDAFYTYFDPFYFNGPLFQTKVDWTLATYNPPSFAACVPFSEHLFWETNPAQGALVREWSAKDAPYLGAGDPKAHYLPWKPDPRALATDPEQSRLGLEATMSTFVRQCAQLAHGDPAGGQDFQADPKAHLEVAIRCVATAYRATLTALRAEAWGRRVNDRADIRLQLSVSTAAGLPAKLVAARVAYRDRAAAGRLVSRPGWSFPLDGRALGAEPTELGVLVEGVPDSVAPTDLVVDLRADFGTFPDVGRARIDVAARTTRTVHNPSGASPVSTKGPVDAVIVMDTTGSMASSIDSLRRNAITSVRRLRERSSDVRLAVVTFRDLGEKDDLPHFKVRPFTRDLEAQFAFLDSLGADGGGDTPEDQLHGVSLALRLWETEDPDPDRVPAKVIIVVTDAPAKSPDTQGNDFDTIATRAFNVDPAHIYPIVVGADAEAAAHARTLAEKTSGRALGAESGDQVADAVLAAVDDAVVTHAPPPPRGRSTRALFFALGGVLIACSAAFTALGLRAKRRLARSAAGGSHG